MPTSPAQKQSRSLSSTWTKKIALSPPPKPEVPNPVVRARKFLRRRSQKRRRTMRISTIWISRTRKTKITRIMKIMKRMKRKITISILNSSKKLNRLFNNYNRKK
jgi:hypothetical protein